MVEPSTPSDWDSSHARDIAVADGRIALAGSGGRSRAHGAVWVLEEANGRLLWSDSFEHDGFPSVATRVDIDRTGLVCASGEPGWVRCYSSTGVLLWDQERPRRTRDMRLEPDGSLLIAEPDVITLIDASSGAVLSQQAVPFDLAAANWDWSSVDLVRSYMLIRYLTNDERGEWRLEVWGLNGERLWSAGRGALRGGYNAQVSADGTIWAPGGELTLFETCL